MMFVQGMNFNRNVMPPNYHLNEETFLNEVSAKLKNIH